MLKKWIETAFQETGNEEDFIHRLYLDGCEKITASEAYSLCQEGKFEEAAHLAHMSGWL